MIIKNFLSDTQLSRFKESFSNEDVWSQSQLTGNTKNFDFKFNREYIGIDKEFLDQELINALSNSLPWREYVVAPKSSGSILYLKYEKNSLYKYHADVSKGTEISFTYASTLFLSDPEEYEGGELILTINNEDIEYKLPCNTLVTYPVGTKHRVNKVTKGTRHVAVFWTESFITDEADRNLIRELNQISRSIHTVLEEEFNINEVTETSFSDVLVDLTRLTETIHNKYPRWRNPNCTLISE